MKNFIKIVLVMISLSTFAPSSANAAWCKGETPLYICIGNTIDIGISSIVAYIKETGAAIMEEVNKITMAFEQQIQQKSTGEDISKYKVVNAVKTGAKSTQIDALTGLKMNAISKPIKDANYPNISVGETTDKVSMAAAAVMMISDSTLAAKKAAHKTLNDFYVLNIFQSLSAIHDLEVAIENIRTSLNDKVLKAAEDDQGDLGKEQKFSSGVDGLVHQASAQKTKLDAYYSMFKTSRNMYTSDDFLMESDEFLNR